MRGRTCFCGNFRDRDLLVKRAILKAYGLVVSVVTYDLPDDMLKLRGSKLIVPGYSDKEPIIWGSGIVIECEPNANGAHCLTILTIAMLFKRTNDLQPIDVAVDVCLPDGEELELESRVICYDFHYNLVALRVESNCSTHVANMKLVDDVLPMDPYELLPHSLQLRPHSDLTKLVPGDLVIALGRHHDGDLINAVLFFREAQRPWLGIDVCNLHVARLDVLLKFPNITIGVIVRKVSEDSPAHLADLQCNDVIVPCDGNPVRSILEFFERTLDKVGECVELGIVRAGTSQPLKRVVPVQETSPDKFYSWLILEWS